MNPKRLPSDRELQAATSTRIATPILYTLREVAQLFRCSTRTVRRMVERGELPRADGPPGKILIPASAVAERIAASR